MYENEDFDPYEAAQDYYEKFQRGTLSRRGGNFDWIGTNNRTLQVTFIEELERLFGPKFKIRTANGCYFSVEELRTQNKPVMNQLIEYDDDER